MGFVVISYWAYKVFGITLQLSNIYIIEDYIFCRRYNLLQCQVFSSFTTSGETRLKNEEAGAPTIILKFSILHVETSKFG